MSSVELLEALGLDASEAPRLVQIIGGGGKTTLMFRLAAALQTLGDRVVTTTTTRIRAPSPEESPALLLEDELGGLEAALSLLGHVTVVGHRRPDGKLRGVSPGLLTALLTRHPRWRVVAECDGSAGRSLKTHAAHEPVLAEGPSLVVCVVGLDALGAPLDDAHVHRSALLAERLGVPMGTLLDVDSVVRAVALYHQRIPPQASTAVFLTKLTPARRELARELARALRGSPSIPDQLRIVAASRRELVALTADS